jgi:hypothetical protein
LGVAWAAPATTNAATAKTTTEVMTFLMVSPFGGDLLVLLETPATGGYSRAASRE